MAGHTWIVDGVWRYASFAPARAWIFYFLMRICKTNRGTYLSVAWISSSLSVDSCEPLDWNPTALAPSSSYNTNRCRPNRLLILPRMPRRPTLPVSLPLAAAPAASASGLRAKSTNPNYNFVQQMNNQTENKFGFYGLVAMEWGKPPWSSKKWSLESTRTSLRLVDTKTFNCT